MSFILKPYLNFDICCKIENINYRYIFKNHIFKELLYYWNTYWKIKFQNYEYRFLSKYLQNKFRIEKIYEHDLYLRYTKPYHVIYDHYFDLVKNQQINYKPYYHNI
jgi:hypothetical protein